MERRLAKLFVKKLVPEAIIPKKGSVRAAGYDLHSIQDVVVPAEGKAVIRTGIAIKTPQDNYARIAPRSGLAAKSHIQVGAGVVDEDYRGEVCVCLFNHAKTDFSVKIGDRIAQLIIEKITPTEIQECVQLDDTERGANGFGSTGVSAELPKNNNNNVQSS